MVATAWPVGRPLPYWEARRARHSARISGPPRRWIAPSTPPPPSSEELAALTMASTRCWVMSPRTSVISTMTSAYASGPCGVGLRRRTLRSLRQTAFAAWWPDMPCTPGPGGVAEEQRKTAGCAVAYGTRASLGRISVWSPANAPQAMSPPT